MVEGELAPVVWMACKAEKNIQIIVDTILGWCLSAQLTLKASLSTSPGSWEACLRRRYAFPRLNI
jgi:hypothetical protein